MFPFATRTTRGTATNWQGFSSFLRLVSRPVVAVPALLLLVAIPHALTILNVLRADADDSWYAARAWAVIHTGWAYSPLDQGIFNHYEGYWTYFGLVGNYMNAAATLLFGPTLFAVRVVPFLSGIVLLALVYLIARKLFSHQAGILSILAGAFSYPYITGSHIGRQDIFVAVFAFGALAIYLYQSNDTFSISSFTSGLLLGLTLDIHLPAIIFPPMFAALAIFDYRWKVFKVGRIWGMLAGFLCAVLYYIVVHILPYPDTYFAISRMQQGSDTMTVPISRLDPAIWWTSILGLQNIVGPSTLLLGAIALGVLLYKRRHSDTRFAILIVALLFACVALMLHKLYFYAIMIAPLFWIITGATTDKLLGGMGGNWQRGRAALLGVALMVTSLCVLSLPNVPLLMQNRYPDFEAAMQFVRQSTQEGKTVLGFSNYWFARPNQSYYSWQQLVYYRRDQPGSSIEDAFRALHPDYIIIDDITDTFMLEDNDIAVVNAYSNVAVSRPELADFMRTYTTLISQDDNPTYGTIRIYQIHW
jgi:4-amino-4-deoxy-L-arabinose transferase-like glycosyltransferase